MIVVFVHVAFVNVFDTTYFAISFVRRAERLVIGQRRPEGRPDLVRRSPEQERRRLCQLIHVVALHVVVGQPERPGVPAAAVLIEPGRLDHAVEGHEVGHDQPSHVASL